MTTTLRPAGPEHLGEDGVRARRFAVCVNSRPVGTIELATDERFGADIGRIVSLVVDEPDRRRGRGTVATLAAEEVLRGWGCRRVVAAVPESAGVALRLATALGYTERNRGMLKQLEATVPQLPEGSSVRLMGEDEYTRWHPDGMLTADTALLVLAHNGTDVGRLWMRLRDPADATGPARVCSVEVDEEHRGHGHSRTLMLVAERECLAAGVYRLAVGVCAGSMPALRLYTSLGYRTTVRTLVKELV
jgi:GNAT superfamily N-acetyltransferase